MDLETLKEKLSAHRAMIEARLEQEPEDDGLRDMLQDIEDGLELMEAEGREAPLSDLAELELRVAERLQE